MEPADAAHEKADPPTTGDASASAKVVNSSQKEGDESTAGDAEAIARLDALRDEADYAALAGREEFAPSDIDQIFT